MAKKKEWLAMLLAGGQGSRLYALTKSLAKPAVPFGGKYRIIDFPLSNCVNSGIDTVGVLTQYQPLVLNEYIGNGQPWDLDRVDGGVFTLPPYQSARGSDWYSGTANAIYQNMSFIERYSPEYVLILSGDHIYKMDYNLMLNFHKEKNSDCTIAVLNVSIDEASRFGIMNTNEDGSVYEFEEKPKKPKSTLASMGIYIFKWEKLRKYLIEDEADKKSTKDFGKDIIPKMLSGGEKVFAYMFDGYWKDVGTVDSLWEANMDLLNSKVPMDLYDASWKIYARSSSLPPLYIAETGKVVDSMVADGSSIAGKVDMSVIFAGVTIEENAVVQNSIVMPGAVIKSGAKVEYAILAQDCIIEAGAKVGIAPENAENIENWGISVVAENVVVGENAVVRPKTILEQNLSRGEEK